MPDQYAKADQKIHERDDDRRRWDNEARKIDLADQICIVDQTIRGFAESGRKKRPRQYASEHHERIRRIAIRRQFGNAAKDNGENQHGEKGANERPQHRQ